MNNIEAIIFDLGNVVFEVDFEPAYAYCSQISELSIETLRERLGEDDDFKRFERGEMSPDEFRTAMSEKIGYSLSQQEYESCWNSIFGEMISGIDSLMQNLKKNYRILILSNTNHTHTLYWSVRYASALIHAEKIFASQEMGTRKPEPEAYQICLNYLKLPPEKTLFLDDREENIAAAMKLGIQAIQVHNFKQMTGEMRSLGILWD